MKKLCKWLSGMQMVLILLAFTVQKVAAQGVEVSYQAFYNDLSPYGQWVSDAQYGNVWIPNGEPAGFRPYATNGHWEMTDYGNTWVSDDPWGWACYHYGRWTYDSYYGWVWVPGYDWAPAWVSWRYGGGYCGWAPLGPGFGISGAYNCPADWWVFVGPQYLYDPGFLHYWRGARYNAGCLRVTNFYRNDYVDRRTNVRYNYGPRRADIEKYTHHPVQVYHLSGMQRAGASGISGHSINMYRPTVNKATIHSARPEHVMAGNHAIGKGRAMSSGHGLTGFKAHPTGSSGQVVGTSHQIGGRHPQGNIGHGNAAHTGFGSRGNIGASHNHNIGAGRMHNANPGGNHNMGNRPQGGMNRNPGGGGHQPRPMGGGMPRGGNNGGFHGGGGHPMGGGMPHGGGGGFHGGGGGGHVGGGGHEGGGGRR